ncbi:MAG: hypothetical protein AB1801_05995 [Chloroflexota bacterium]
MFHQHKRHYHKWVLAVIFVALPALVSLACSLGGSESAGAIRIRNLLPTFTPTVVAGAPVEQRGEAVPPGELAAQPAQAAPVLPTATPTPIRMAHLPTLTPTTLPAQAVGMANPSLKPASPTAVQAVSNPTLAAISTATPAPAASPNPAATPNPTATLPPPPDEEAPPSSAVPGWSFRGLHTSLTEGNAVVVGEIINNTGSPQQAVEVSGVFYDALDQVIEDEIDTLSYVPVEVIPVGAHVPFELVVESPQPIFRLDLEALSQPASDSPRQDFQFANINQWSGGTNMYCLGGQVQNLGLPLAGYLVIMATTYDAQGQVVGFGEYAPTSPENIVGDQTSPFEMCIDPLDQHVARHEFRALGY